MCHSNSMPLLLGIFLLLGLTRLMPSLSTVGTLCAFFLRKVSDGSASGSGWTVHSLASANEIISSRRATDGGPLGSAANRRLLVFPGTEKESVHFSSKYSSRELPIRLLSKRIESTGVVTA
ncbi:unnamed protein product, partial [Ixodes persulcatus]